MGSFTIPPDNRAGGNTGHLTDHSHIADALTAIATFNVMNTAYGATGNGSTDDTTAVQAAITAAQAAGGRVYFPAGTYLISSSLSCGGGTPGAIEFFGDGWNSQIKLKNGANCYLFDTGSGGSPQFTNGICFRDLYFQCNAANQTGASGAIYGRGSVFGVFDHIWVDSPYDAGLWFYQDGLGNYGHHNRITNSLFTGGYASASYGLAIRFQQADENSVIGCTFQDNGTSTYPGTQVYDTNAGLQTFQGCSFVTTRATSAAMIKTDSSPASIKILGCCIDSSTTGNQLEINGDQSSIIGNDFLNGAAAAIHLSTNFNRVIGNNFRGAGSGSIAVHADAGTSSNLVCDNTTTGTFASNTPYTGCAGIEVSTAACGAKCDGSTDDTTAIQAALNSAGSAGGTVIVPAGTSLISQTLQITSDTEVRGMGTGVSVIKAKASYAASQVGSNLGLCMVTTLGSTTASNIKLHSFTLDNNQANTSSLPGYADNAESSPLSLWAVTNLAIEDMEVLNPIGYAMYIVNCSYFSITNNYVLTGQGSKGSWGNQDGIHVSAGHGGASGTSTVGVITGNRIDTGTVSTYGDDGIALQSYGTLSDITVGHNVIRAAANGIGVYISPIGPPAATVSNVTIEANNIWATVNRGILVTCDATFYSGSLLSGITVSDNVLSGVGQSGIMVANVNAATTACWANVTIDGNVIGLSGTGSQGIYCTSGTGLSITDNKLPAFAATSAPAIQVGDNSSGSCTVTDFTVNGNTAVCTVASVSGMYIVDSQDGTITGNILVGNAGSGSSAISLLGIGSAVTGLAIGANRCTGFPTGVSEGSTHGGDYNAIVGNVLHGCTTATSVAGSHDVTASNA